MARNHTGIGLAIILATYCQDGIATESIEFVAEHLPEIAMDNRFASLPLWNVCDAGTNDSDGEFCFGMNAGYARTHSGTLSIDGPMIALSASRPLGKQYRLTGFLFFDELSLAGGVEHRPLEVLFANPPLTLPAEAEFTGLDGEARDVGFGLALNGVAHLGWFPWFEWSAGLMWQRFRLSDYRFNYLITGGPDGGTSGTLDYSATYTHHSPFVGAAWPRARGVWHYAPHVQVAVPRPRRGVVGRITGPGFDLSGNTEDNAGRAPFGDPSLTIGFNVTYEPWHLTVDLGSTITQALIEPRIHEGVQHDLMLSANWTF
jgi:hypothetical protein